MKLNVIRSKRQTEDLLLSTNENCGTLIKQIHTKPAETLELKLYKPKEAFRFQPPISIEGSCMIGVCNESGSIQFYFYCSRRK